jgi:hypothetical protein
MPTVPQRSACMAHLPIGARIVQWLLLGINAILNGCIWLAPTATGPATPAAVANAPDGDALTSVGIAIGGTIAIISLLLGLRVCAGNSVFQAIYGWISLLLPTCWLGHAVANVLWLVNSGAGIGWIAHALGTAAGATVIDDPIGRSGSVVISRQLVLSWLPFPPVFTCAWFSALAPEQLWHGALVAPALRRYLRGRQLNHAAYGICTVARFAEEESTSFFEAMAESMVEVGERRCQSHDQEADHLRAPMWCADDVVVVPG